MLTWVDGEYGSTRGMRNNIRLFTVMHDGLMPRGSNKPAYKLTTDIPGLKGTIGHYETETLAKEAAETALLSWLNHMGFTAKEE